MKKGILAVFIYIMITQTFAQNITAKRYVLTETFTNTYCSTCANFDPPATATYFANISDVHQISYYPNVPFSICTFHQENTVDNIARKNYYGIGGTPLSYTMGTAFGSGNNLLSQNTINQFSGENSAIRVKVSISGAGNIKTANVEVKSYETPPTGDLRLFVVGLVEESNFNAPNGLNEHHNILWDIFTSENGDAITLPAIGASQTFSFNYDLNNVGHPSWDSNDVYVVAFVQNYQTKEVINSGSSKDITLEPTIVNSDCNCTGSIAINPSGGNPPYQYTWSNGSASSSITNLCPGNYSVEIFDGERAVDTEITIVEEFPTLSINGLPSNPISANAAYPLSGSPSGGNFSGPGVVFGTFNSGIAGVGLHQINYNLNQNGCLYSSSEEVLVFSVSYNFVQNNISVISPKELILDIEAMEAGTYGIEVINTNGQIVKNDNLILGNGKQIKSIDLSELNAGIYFLNFIGEYAAQTKSFYLN